MPTYLIENTLSGVLLGAYEGENEQAAYRAMCADAGESRPASVTDVSGIHVYLPPTDRGLTPDELDALIAALDLDSGDMDWLPADEGDVRAELHRRAGGNNEVKDADCAHCRHYPKRPGWTRCTACLTAIFDPATIPSDPTGYGSLAEGGAA